MLGPDGRAYGSDEDRALIRIFSMVDGSLFHQIAVSPRPRVLVLIKMATYILDHGVDQNIIRVYTPSGVLVRSYTPPSAGLVDGIFIDRAGNRLISDRTSSKADYHRQEQQSDQQAEGFSYAVITPNGDVWVTHAGQNKVFVYSSE